MVAIWIWSRRRYIRTRGLWPQGQAKRVVRAMREAGFDAKALPKGEVPVQPKKPKRSRLAAA
jgi:hypothetical protein